MPERVELSERSGGSTLSGMTVPNTYRVSMVLSDSYAKIAKILTFEKRQ